MRTQQAQYAQAHHAHTHAQCWTCGEEYHNSLLNSAGNCEGCVRDAQDKAEAKEDSEREKDAQARIDAEVETSLRIALDYNRALSTVLNAIFPTRL